jgi:hypothetical protein
MMVAIHALALANTRATARLCDEAACAHGAAKTMPQNAPLRDGARRAQQVRMRARSMTRHRHPQHRTRNQQHAGIAAYAANKGARVMRRSQCDRRRPNERAPNPALKPEEPLDADGRRRRLVRLHCLRASISALAAGRISSARAVAKAWKRWRFAWRGGG